MLSDDLLTDNLGATHDCLTPRRTSALENPFSVSSINPLYPVEKKLCHKVLKRFGQKS
jgi:hypothetical protein